MKRILNKLERDEKGQALLIVLILLVVGGLIIGPLLGFMSTGLIVGQVYEERMDELYAADAGVEDAIWKIITKATGLPQTEVADPMEYSIDDVNGKEFDEDAIVIEYIDEITYRIESTATSPDTGSSTTIESYINILSFSDFMDNVITSPNNVDIQPNTNITGDIQYNGTLDNKGNWLDGDEITDEIEGWPTAEQLHAYYWPDVKDYPYDEDTIDLKNTTNIDSLYKVGNLVITNTGSPGATLTLNGTVYVTGNLDFAQTGIKDYEIHLNGQTIYVEGEIVFPSARCAVYGSGCIIAVGNIDFQPSLESEEYNFVFVMSVEGEVRFKPATDFYGSIAGDFRVNAQPGGDIFWSGPPPDLKYPGAEPSTRNVIQAIRTWEISLQ